MSLIDELFGVANRNALATGGSSGIGRAMAESWSADGSGITADAIGAGRGLVHGQGRGRLRIGPARLARPRPPADAPP